MPSLRAPGRSNRRLHAQFRSLGADIYGRSAERGLFEHEAVYWICWVPAGDFVIFEKTLSDAM